MRRYLFTGLLLISLPLLVLGQQSAVLRSDFSVQGDAFVNVPDLKLYLRSNHTYYITGTVRWTAGGTGMAMDFDGGTAVASAVVGAACANQNYVGGLIQALDHALFAVDDASTNFAFTVEVTKGGTLIPRLQQLTPDPNMAALWKGTVIKAEDVTP